MMSPPDHDSHPSGEVQNCLTFAALVKAVRGAAAAAVASLPTNCVIRLKRVIRQDDGTVPGRRTLLEFPVASVLAAELAACSKLTRMEGDYLRLLQ